MDDFPHSWAMYEDEGNYAVSQMMREVKAALYNKPLPEVRKLLRSKMKIVGQDYGEIYDTDVRYLIANYLTKWACEVHDLKQPWNLNPSYWELY